MFGIPDKKRIGEVARLKKYIPVTSVTLPEGLDPNDLTAEEVEKIYGEYRG